MSDYNDDLEFDDELPDADLSDLDFLDEEREGSTELVPATGGEVSKYEKQKKDIEIYKEDTDTQYLDYTEEDFKDVSDGHPNKKVKKKKKHLALKIIITVLVLLLAFAAFLAFTPPGRKLVYRFAAKWIADRVNGDIPEGDDSGAGRGEGNAADLEMINSMKEGEVPERYTKDESVYKHEEYVKTYLLYGIEEFDGASNTDSIMLLSVNTKDNTLKLTSIMRDTFVEMQGFYSNKINSVYAHGKLIGSTAEERKTNGANLLMNVIGKTFDIDITGYMSVNFKNFEKIVDRLGGVDIELGEREANYLNKTNYISEPSNRNVHAGWNHLNGNQVLGYCRVRKVPNVKGTNYDYGRTERQRMVMEAIIQQYKSLSLFEMYSVLADCLQYVTTDLNQDMLAEAIEDVVENKVYTVKQMRLPIDGLFRDSGEKGIKNGNGKTRITYALVMDADELVKTIKKFHKFVFGESESGEK